LLFLLLNSHAVHSQHLKSPPPEHAALRFAKGKIALLSLLVLLAGLVFLPGMSGPFVFDDATNILTNTYIQTHTLDARALYHASYSLAAGPLHRPIAMLSFALNYYFAGSFDDPTPFKLTNIAIHAINGLLMFWLLRLVFARLVRIGWRPGPARLTDRHIPILLAAGVTLLWLVHPIQLTSVLYVVQRMVSLAALFTLLGLIGYIKGRERTISGKAGGTALIALSLAGCGTLGVLSKENAILLPVFALTLEYTLFRSERPWSTWAQIPPRTRWLVIAIVAIAAIALFGWTLHYTLPGYQTRNFNLLERVLTETRVLFFYIFLILAPRIDRFGLYHDDIPLSTSILTPWTTLPSIVGLIALFALGLASAKRHPLLSLGILWFFTSHLLESTIISLEITHEHRNYLASLGVLLVVIHLINRAAFKFDSIRIWALLPLLAIVFSAVTLMRSSQWSDFNTLAHYEAHHHPDSPAAQLNLGIALAKQQAYPESIEAYRRAAELDPSDVLSLINMHLVSLGSGVPLKPRDRAEILKRLAEKPLSGSAYVALERISGCIQTDCAMLQGDLEKWLQVILKTLPATYDRSVYYYFLGRTLAGEGHLDEALQPLRVAYALDPMYLHPLFEIVRIYIQQQKLDEAERALAELRKANQGNLHPRDQEIDAIAGTIVKLRRAAAPTSAPSTRIGQK
jgi:tetratricopeptide (TPR) repeat protein